MHKILILLLISLLFASCGEFIGLRDNGSDIGHLSKVSIFLNSDDKYKLYNSVSLDDYVPCLFSKDDCRNEKAEIKVRGYTSRMHSKKSFSVKTDKEKYVLERGRYDGGADNRIAMRAYQLAGLPAPDIESVGLFINEEYIGCYNLIYYYSEDVLGGELYKCYFSEYEEMGKNHPLASLSKKKFPKDDDMSSLEYLISAAVMMSYSGWCDFVCRHVDIDKFSSYMAVHDFMTVKDTHMTNFYIHYDRDGKYSFLPWDNEYCMYSNSSGYPLGGDNQLTKRLMAVPQVKAAYNEKMRRFFTGKTEAAGTELSVGTELSAAKPRTTGGQSSQRQSPGKTRQNPMKTGDRALSGKAPAKRGDRAPILDTLKREADEIFQEIAPAVKNDPMYGSSFDHFLREKRSVAEYLDREKGRASELSDPAIP